MALAELLGRLTSFVITLLGVFVAAVIIFPTFKLGDLIAGLGITSVAIGFAFKIIQGLITGIGFIGGGAILKDRGSVHGTATATSIWNTRAIGAAVAFKRYEIALVLSFINFATLRLLTPLKRHVDQ